APAPLSNQNGSDNVGSTENWAGSSSTFSDPATSRKVVYRTVWGYVIFGLLLILLGGTMLQLAGESSKTTRTSRRVRAMEELIGEKAMAVLSCLVIIGAGAYLIYASRVEVTQAAPTSNATHGCNLCGKTSTDSAEAYVTIGGGMDTFTGAFRCFACNECVRSAQWLWRASILQAFMFITGAIIVVPFVIVCIALIVGSAEERKPGSTTFLLFFFGVSAFILFLNVVLQYWVWKQTGQVLGGRLDNLIRQIAGIKRWGWPRRISLNRFVATNTPIIDVTQN
ncbi:MAG: hypothetical protein K2Z81_23700, partial [Cyanobacteria bacterium]|nr:hypothetical protein [Cyanobacteriota bacterium]